MGSESIFPQNRCFSSIRKSAIREFGKFLLRNKMFMRKFQAQEPLENQTFVRI